jgi:hypothetical protein
MTLKLVLFFKSTKVLSEETSSSDTKESQTKPLMESPSPLNMAKLPPLSVPLDLENPLSPNFSNVSTTLKVVKSLSMV